MYIVPSFVSFFLWIHIRSFYKITLKLLHSMQLLKLYNFVLFLHQKMPKESILYEN